MQRLNNQIHPSLHENVLKALKDIKIVTVFDFIEIGIKIIEKNTTLTFQEILQIKEYLLKNYSPKVQKGLNAYKFILSNSAIIPTGIEKVDSKLLKGGFTTGHIYEISGGPATGKTLFCLHLIKNVISSLKQPIFYLDSKNNFSARKLKQLLPEHIQNDKKLFIETMQFPQIIKLYNKFDLINAVHCIKDDLKGGGLKGLRVIIIDSLVALFADHSQDHFDNNSILNNFANISHYLAHEYQIVFIVINLITQWNPGDFETREVTQEKISCGRYWATVPQCKLKFEKINDQSLKISFMKNNISKFDNSVELTFSDSKLQ